MRKGGFHSLALPVSDLTDAPRGIRSLGSHKSGRFRSFASDSTLSTPFRIQLPCSVLTNRSPLSLLIWAAGGGPHTHTPDKREGKSSLREITALLQLLHRPLAFAIGQSRPCLRTSSLSLVRQSWACKNRKLTARVLRHAIRSARKKFRQTGATGKAAQCTAHIAPKVRLFCMACITFRVGIDHVRGHNACMKLASNLIFMRAAGGRRTSKSVDREYCAVQ